MAATYEPIASQTLGSAAASVTLSGIPGIYTDLVAIMWGQSADANNRSHALRFNSDSSAVYSFTLLDGNGTAASSGRATSLTAAYVGNIPLSTNAAPGLCVAHIMSYSNTNVYKTVLSGSSAPELSVRRYVNLWRSTSAITSVTWMKNDGSNIAAGGTFSLYGIKAA